jgi:hypothetical protein
MTLVAAGFIAAFGVSPASSSISFDSYTGPLFAPSSPFNVRLASTPRLDPSSATKISALMSAIASYGVSLNIQSYSPAIYVGSASDPQYTVKFTKSWGSSTVNGAKVRVPSALRPPSDSDGHVTIIWNGYAYSLYQTKAPSSGVISASWGGRAKLDGDGNTEAGAVGGRGSGISQIAGVITPQDVRSGVIRHALAISYRGSLVSRSYVRPAVKSDGSASGSQTVKMGQRLRLNITDAEINAIKSTDAQKTAIAKMIATAMRDYGAIVVDRTSSAFAVFLANPLSYTSLGLANPWDALLGRGPYYVTPIMRSSGIPWNKLQVLAP